MAEIFLSKSARRENGKMNSVRETILENTPIGKEWEFLMGKKEFITEQIGIKFDYDKCTWIKQPPRCVYDFDLVYTKDSQEVGRVKMEYKFGSKSLYKLPQFVQISTESKRCQDLFLMTYGNYWYKEYLTKIVPENIMAKEDYLKQVVKTSSKDPFFSEVKRNVVGSVVNESVKNYLTVYGKEINIGTVTKMINDHQDKVYVLMTKDDVKIERFPLAGELSFSRIHRGNTVIVTDGRNEYHLLLRWKNYKGVLNPAWQIKIEPCRDMSEFSQTSQSMIKQIPLSQRKKEGIFFTPLSIRQKLLSLIPPGNYQEILEPSFGSGEFIHDLRILYPDSHITGIEKNDLLFFSVPEEENVTLVHQDFLKITLENRYNLIIGNPPFFTVNIQTNGCKTKKSNMYINFLYKCVSELIVPGGIIAFILPASLLNCSSYDPCRSYIKANFDILNICPIESFPGTGQKTMLFVIKQNNNPGLKYISIVKGSVYFVEDNLSGIMKGSVSLKSLGCSVKVGNIVWNENKDKMSDHGTLLLYSENIHQGKIVLTDQMKNGKKQYITGINKPPLLGPMILLSRGYGNKFKLTYSLFDQESPFYIENHILYITGPKNVLDQVLISFDDPRSQDFCTAFVQNGNISCRDMENIFPIFV